MHSVGHGAAEKLEYVPASHGEQPNSSERNCPDTHVTVGWAVGAVGTGEGSGVGTGDGSGVGSSRTAAAPMAAQQQQQIPRHNSRSGSLGGLSVSGSGSSAYFGV